jgi:hypothetical protein
MIEIADGAKGNSTLFRKRDLYFIRMKTGKDILILRNEKPGARLKRLKSSLKNFRQAEREIARRLAEEKTEAINLKRSISKARQEVAVEKGIQSWIQSTEHESWALTLVDRSPNRETFRLSGTTNGAPYSWPINICPHPPTRHDNHYDNWPGRPKWRTSARQRARKQNKEPNYYYE